MKEKILFFIFVCPIVLFLGVCVFGAVIGGVVLTVEYWPYSLPVSAWVVYAVWFLVTRCSPADGAGPE